MSIARKPVIGIVCCSEQLGLHPFNIVGEKYILGVVDGADGLPLLIPALGERLDNAQLLSLLDVYYHQLPVISIVRYPPTLET